MAGDYEARARLVVEVKDAATQPLKQIPPPLKEVAQGFLDV